MVRFAKTGIALAITAIVPVCTSPKDDGIAKKRMPDLFYVYSVNQKPTSDLEASAARALELYSSDPDIFSDPVGIIDSLPAPEDSTSLKRTCGIILSDHDWTPPDSLIKGKIDGGRALSLTYNKGFGRLDSCWREIIRYARENEYDIRPPGIEIYRGYENETPDATTELIVRIK